MSDEVKARRRYTSERRQEQARRTRREVQDAARRRFMANGYAPTTIAEVAADAGVSVETVYKAFGNKAGLLKAVIDVAIVGDDQPIPMLQREFVRKTMAEPDPRRKLLAYGDHLAEVLPRTGHLVMVLRAAAASDEGAAAVWDQLQAERLTGMSAFASHLGKGGHLREGVSVAEARDILWLHNSVEVWDLLVNQRGWSNRRYGRWVARQLIAALL